MYFSPFVDNVGLHIPTYQDILDDLIAAAQSIYGSDIYLGNDSPDYQFLSALALKMSDNMQAIQLAYNNRSPVSAIGIGLDVVVALNGITRLSAGYSAAPITITGTPNTIINNGVVSDSNGYKWDLPTPVTIPIAGSIIVTAICETIGAIQAGVGTITKILTPTSGWISATNATAAVPGNPVETDSQLRARQAVSVELPSQTLLNGTRAAIAAISGVTRWAVYENSTDSANNPPTVIGPPHSITAVVEGGTDAAVAMAIYLNKGPGCNTNGTTPVNVVDPEYGNTVVINLFHLAYTTITVAITIAPLTGYVSSMKTAVQAAIVNYINSLGIFQNVRLSAVEAIAMAVNADLTKPNFSVTALTLNGSAADVAIAYNAAAQTAANDVTVTD